MKVIKRLSIQFTLASCLVSAPCLADDVDDALATPSYALKCPIPPISAFQHLSYHQEINTSSSVQQILQIENETRFGDGIIQRQIDTVKFADIVSVRIGNGPSPNEWGVTYQCAVKTNCIREGYGGREGYTGGGRTANFARVTVCDQETAGYVKLAIDTLIKWNKENESQLKAADPFANTSTVSGGSPGGRQNGPARGKPEIDPFKGTSPMFPSPR